LGSLHPVTLQASTSTGTSKVCGMATVSDVSVWAEMAVEVEVRKPYPSCGWNTTLVTSDRPWPVIRSSPGAAWLARCLEMLVSTGVPA
jgi:hypothetical protein